MIQAIQQKSREDLLSFCIYTDQFYEVAPHHELITEHLKKLMDGEIQNLIIEMPPRAGKSRIMEEFIAYLLGTQQNTDILYTGHTLSILEDFSRHIRNRINSEEYKQLFQTRISGDNAAVKSWSVHKGGIFSIFGVGGGITGKGGDIMVIDDPYKSRQDAESDTVRKTVSDWYWSTFLSRKQDDKAKQIIIMQRWREDDLVGEILEKEGDKWTELKIPALDDNDNSFWPSRFNNEYFYDIRQANPIFFSSQYQQDPVNQGGGDFLREYFEYYMPDDIIDIQGRLSVLTFIDPAISKKQEADNTAIVTIGVDSVSNLIYLLEVKKLKDHPDEIIDELFITADRYSDYGKSYRAGIEVVQYQKMLALEIKKQMRIRDNFFTLDEVRPQGEKEARIRTTLQPRYSSHTVIHPKYSPNVGDLEMELLKFPNGKHDDMIDALSSCLALNKVQARPKKTRTASRNTRSYS